MSKAFSAMTYDEAKAALDSDTCIHSIVNEVVNQFNKKDVVDMITDLELIVAIHKKYQKKVGFIN